MNFAALFLVSALAACSSDGGGGGTSTVDDDATGDDNDEQDDDNGDKPSATMCTDEGATKTCACDNGDYGTRKCTKGKFTQCNCDGVKQDAGPRPDYRSKCKAGYYTGNFTGKYRPGAFGFGLLGSGFEVDIAGGKSLFNQDLPPLAFTLTEEQSGVSGEFATFTVGGGCMQGLATALFTENPFVAKLTGNLDCNTGEFSGTLEGYYTLLSLPGANFNFKGPLTAQFNLEQASLDDGEWSVEEPPALNGDPAGGGDGVWDAKWVSNETPMVEMDPCAMIMTTGDAGLPPVDTEKDAGVANPDAGN